MYKNPQWIHFYGAHDETVDKKVKEKMNKFPEIASRFKGSLLLSLNMEIDDEPSFRVEDMHNKEKDEENNLTYTTFQARLDIEFV